MTGRNTRAAVSVVLLCVLVGAGCSRTEAGTVANDPPPAAPAPSAGGAPRYPSRGVFGDVKACELLDQALAGQGYPPGEESTLGSDNGCDTLKRGSAPSLNLDDVQAFNDLRDDKSKQHAGVVNGRPAIQVRDGGGLRGTCGISVRVAVQARALVTVAVGSSNDTGEACRQAGEIASVVEPGLPEQG